MKNENLQSLISELKKASIENEVSLWKTVAETLEGSTKKRPVVNLSKIDKYAKDDETVIVPGKVLSMGDLSKKITIAAFRFSNESVQKIKASGGKAVSINELARKNPKGSKVRLLA